MVVDRLVLRPGIERRLTDSLETALKLADGVAEIQVVPREPVNGSGRGGGAEADVAERPGGWCGQCSRCGSADAADAADGETLIFSQHLACPVCGTSYDELAPRNFSFNSPYGACPSCDGLGTRYEVDPELVVPDPDLSIDEGAVAPWAGRATSISGGCFRG